MAFDAGTIIAHLDIDPDAFDRKLARAKADARRAENEQYKVKVSAVFDDASTSKAKKAFSDLDQQISRDAMSRLRSSPQGSVLGALVALFSPHQVSGGPTPQQASTQGLLGRMLNQTSQAASRNNAGIGTLLSRLAGRGGDGGKGAVTALAEAAGGDGGGDGGRGSRTTLTTRIPLTPASLTTTVGAGKMGLLTGGIGAALAALPALGGVAGVGIGTALIGGLAVTLLKQNAKVKSAVSEMGKQVMPILESTIKPLVPAVTAVIGRIAPLIRSLAPELTGVFRTLAPQIAGIFDNVAKVIKDLVGLMKAAAPAVGPFINGLLMLVQGVLPGLTSLIRAVVPDMGKFAFLLDQLGHDIGGLFSAMAPAVGASMRVLTALLGAVGSLLPVIGKLAGSLAQMLAPILTQIAHLFVALEPAIKIVLQVFAQLAGAVLVNILGGLKALVGLVVAIQPAFSGFVKIIGQVFNLLNNRGVLNDFEDALEGLVGPISRLVIALLHGLEPILPPVIQFIGQLAKVLQVALIQAVTALVPPLIQLANVAFKTLSQVLPIVLPLVLKFAGIFTQALVVVIQAVAVALSAIIEAIPPSLLTKIVIGILAIVAAVKAWGIAMAIVTAISDANPIGLIALAVAGLVVGITLLVTHWKAVWGVVKQVADDAWNFIYNGFGKFLLPLLGPAGLIALGAIELAQHWKTIWGGIKQVASDFNQWIVNDFGHSLTNFFTQTIPHVFDAFVGFVHSRLISPFETGLNNLGQWIGNRFVIPVDRLFTQTIPNAFHTAVGAIGRAWTAVENAVRGPVNWVITHVINDGLIHAFDWISSKVGGPHIADVPTMAAGGLITKGSGPTADDVLARVSKGETVVSAHDSKVLAPIFAAMGIPGYAAGGIPGAGVVKDIGHAIARGAKAVFSGFGTAAHVVGDLVGGGGKILAALATGNAAALTNAIRGLIPGGVGGAVADMAQLMTDIPKTLVHYAVQKLLGLFGGSGSSARYTGKYGAGVAQWRGDVETALRMLGLPLSLTNQVLYQMNTESGGNPNAINLTDSNAAAGDPSRGLLQTIMTTFEAYRSPSLPNNIYNPLANIYAAINYARHVYGPTLMRGGMGLGSGHGYDQGGWLMPGWSFNGTQHPEAVLTTGQSAAFVTAAAALERLAKGGGTVGSLLRDVYLTLPEGATVSQALQELDFRLRTAHQTNYAGVGFP